MIDHFRRWWLEGALALLALGLAAEVCISEVQTRAFQQAEKPSSVLAQLSERLDRQPHECIPLGWFPAGEPARGFYPDYNAGAAAPGRVFQSGWLAVVRPGAPQAEAAAVKGVLDELARIGLVEHRTLSDGVHYTLTHEGARYYYDRNDLDNNVEGWPYLCFSHLRTTRIAWSGPAVHGDRWYVSRRVRFAWTSRLDAPWITPFLKAHAVELAPVSNPAEAEARRYVRGQWRLTGLSFEFGLVEHRSAWTARPEVNSGMST